MCSFRHRVLAVLGACLLSLAGASPSSATPLDRPTLNGAALADANSPAEAHEQRIHQLENDVAELQVARDAAEAKATADEEQLAAQQQQLAQLQAQVEGLLQRHADEDAKQAAANAAIAGMIKQSCLLEAGKAPPPECVAAINGMVSGVQGGGLPGMAGGTLCPVTPAGQTPPPGCN